MLIQRPGKYPVFAIRNQLSRSWQINWNHSYGCRISYTASLNLSLSACGTRLSGTGKIECWQFQPPAYVMKLLELVPLIIPSGNPVLLFNSQSWSLNSENRPAKISGISDLWKNSFSVIARQKQRVVSVLDPTYRYHLKFNPSATVWL